LVQSFGVDPKPVLFKKKTDRRQCNACRLLSPMWTGVLYLNRPGIRYGIQEMLVANSVHTILVAPLLLGFALIVALLHVVPNALHIFRRKPIVVLVIRAFIHLPLLEVSVFIESLTGSISF